MRSISSAGLALLASGRFGMAQLIDMELTQTVYVTTARDSIDWSGRTYVGGKQSGVEQVREAGGEVTGLAFTLSGVPLSYLALALAEPIQGKIVTLRLALLDPDTLQPTDVMQLWKGTLDQMPIAHGAETATIKVTAEHRGITFARPRGLRYTDADQQRLFPGDRSLEFIVAQATHEDIWPAASFFQR